MFTFSSRTRRALTGAAIAAITAISLASSTQAASAASDSASTALVSVSQGTGSAVLANSNAVGATDPATLVRVSFILRSPHLADLEHRVASGWSGHYLSTQQFAQQYGQSPAVIHDIRAYLHSFGITTYSYADGLDISATGTAAEFNEALTISLQNFRVKSVSPIKGGASKTTTVYGTKKDPRLPAHVGSPILAILGLSNYSPFTSNAVKAPVSLPASKTPAAFGLPAGELAPEDFVDRYNLAPLEANGAKGQGQTIGIVTLASIDPTVPFTFWNDYLGLNEPASRLKLVEIDGGAGAPSLAAGTVETDLDVEQSGAIAPAAKVRVYEAPNTDPGFADAFFAAASDNIADTVSVSWGESETFLQAVIKAGLESPQYGAVFDEVYAEFGAQGQSNFDATGDAGAYEASSDLETTNLSVDTSSDSPFTTAAGGTTIPTNLSRPVVDSSGNPTGPTVTVDIPTERAWGWDYLWPLIAARHSESLSSVATDLSDTGGATGGYSVLEPRPSYQTGISAYNDRKFLTGTDPQVIVPGLTEPTAFSYNPTPPLASGVQTKGRGVPDLSTNADPETGYAVYDPALSATGFDQYGGTSFVAPQLNGATAVIDSYVGHRVGFWNPKIYSWARSGNSPFTPLNDTTVYSGKQFLYETSATGVITAIPGEFSNDNLFYTGKWGAYWNPATGLGIPNLTELAHKFAH